MPSGTIIHSSSKATEGLTRNQPGLARRLLRGFSGAAVCTLAVVVFIGSEPVKYMQNESRNTVSVGGGLPPIAECQSQNHQLVDRYREQAPPTFDCGEPGLLGR